MESSYEISLRHLPADDSFIPPADDSYSFEIPSQMPMSSRHFKDLSAENTSRNPPAQPVSSKIPPPSRTAFHGQSRTVFSAPPDRDNSFSFEIPTETSNLLADDDFLLGSAVDDSFAVIPAGDNIGSVSRDSSAAISARDSSSAIPAPDSSLSVSARDSFAAIPVRDSSPATPGLRRTLVDPARPTFVDRPLTLAELTPKPRQRSSPRPRERSLSTRPRSSSPKLKPSPFDFANSPEFAIQPTDFTFDSTTVAISKPENQEDVSSPAEASFARPSSPTALPPSSSSTVPPSSSSSSTGNSQKPVREKAGSGHGEKEKEKEKEKAGRGEKEKALSGREDKPLSRLGDKEKAASSRKPKPIVSLGPIAVPSISRQASSSQAQPSKQAKQAQSAKQAQPVISREALRPRSEQALPSTSKQTLLPRSEENLPSMSRDAQDYATTGAAALLLAYGAVLESRSGNGVIGSRNELGSYRGKGSEAYERYALLPLKAVNGC
ncbi:hypothetical protein C8J56DRAFT_38305 [Mycena floridula]|nr:hypothetical protein C8J56DRAFT_38305 [Mycena floridula]